MHTLQAHITVWSTLVWLVLLCAVFATGDYGLGPPPTEGSDTQNDGSVPTSTDVCSPQCHCNKQSVWCQNISKSAVRLIPSSTVSLSIKSSQVKDLDFSHLEYLFFLSLSRNNASEISTRNFVGLKNLQHLDLSYNRITSLTNAPFRSLKELQVLDLSYNHVTMLSYNSFAGLDNLKNLTLRGNLLGGVNRNCFENLSKLEYCDLSHNELAVVSSHWFLETRVKNLLLNHNYLSSLALSNLQHLEVLDASTNHIDSVVLDTLPKLFQLVLRGNGINSMDTFILKNIPMLESIDLSNNTFKALEKRLNNIPTLKYVYLSDLPNLEYLEDDVFHGSWAIESLTVSNSQLKGIRFEAFKGLRNLRSLSIRGNRLNALHSKVFDDVGDLKELDMSENPWTCDCFLQWLRDWEEGKQLTILNERSTRCAGSRSNMSLYDELELLNCSSVSIEYTNILNPFKLGSSALLECQASGNPAPSVTWVTPKNLVFHWIRHSNVSVFATHPTSHYRNMTAINDTETKERFQVLDNGFLHIKKVSRRDGGRYYCFASNPTSNATTSVTLIISNQELLEAKIISILVGVASSIGFILVMLIVQLIKMIINRWGCCCQETLSPRYKQIRQMLETIEQYRCQQLEWLSNNYTEQVNKIKDNCADQLTKLRDSYSTQVKNLHSITTFGSNQLAGVRDQYLEQVKRIRDYSMCQMNRVGENYMLQRNRIRKFSTGQMLKLRETYKFQQRTLNKILEKFPSLYLDNCRSGTCARTDSIMFDDELPGFDQYIVTDIIPYSFETESQSSQYYTPEGSYTPRNREDVSDGSYTPRNDMSGGSSTSTTRRNSEQPNVHIVIENNEDETKL